MIAAINAIVANFMQRNPKPAVGVINMSIKTMPLGARAGDEHAKALRNAITDVRYDIFHFIGLFIKHIIASRRQPKECTSLCQLATKERT